MAAMKNDREALVRMPPINGRKSGIVHLKGLKFDAVIQFHANLRLNKFHGYQKNRKLRRYLAYFPGSHPLLVNIVHVDLR